MELKLQWQGKPGREGLFGSEWAIHTPEGSYACSTTVGLNTRPYHGLLAVQLPGNLEPLLIVSHFQEEYVSRRESQLLYVAEYANAFHDAGMSAFRRFKLFPAPTFVYRVGEAQIHKTVLLLDNPTCLVVRYKASGNPGKTDRLRIRPFFAFRPVTGKVDPQRFVTQDFFLETERQFRFLPFPEAPEIFGAFSGALFESDPLWYYQFRYRKAAAGNFLEDLLSTGYWEMNLRDSREMFVAVSLQPVDPETLKPKFKEQIRRRWHFLSATRKKGYFLNQLRGTLESYRRSVPDAGDFYAASLPNRFISLTAHFRILRCVLRAGVSADWGVAENTSIVILPKVEEFLIWLNNNHSTLLADLLTPFEYIYFIYEYLNRYPGRSLLKQIYSQMEQLVGAMEKGKVKGLKIERSGRVSVRKGHREPLNDILFNPFSGQNGETVLTVEWYVINKMAAQLATLSGKSNSRFEKNAQRAMRYFLENLNPMLEKQLLEKPESMPAVFVRMLTSPFALLKPSLAKQLFLTICQNHLKPDGLLFSKAAEASAYNISDFLRASRLWFPAENSFRELFGRIRENWYREFSGGVLGQMRIQLREAEENTEIPRSTSAVMIAELLFLHSQLYLKSL